MGLDMYLEKKVEIAYWRKAYFLHDWFIENCNRGEVIYSPIIIRSHKIIKLYRSCQIVLKARNNNNNIKYAKKLLPNYATDEYGEIYYSCIEDTMKQLESVINDLDIFDSFYYSASW